MASSEETKLNTTKVNSHPEHKNNTAQKSEKNRLNTTRAQQ